MGLKPRPKVSFERLWSTGFTTFIHVVYKIVHKVLLQHFLVPIFIYVELILPMK